MEAESGPQEGQQPQETKQPRGEKIIKLLGIEQNWRFRIKFIAFSLVFLAVQFLYQFYFLTNYELGGSLVRSFALSGATFISFALFSSIIFKWFPIYSRLWYIRRWFGVMGFVFIVFHVIFVSNFLFQWKLSGIVYSLNPLENPMIFGLIALPIFGAMAITSTDKAVEKLGFKRWKALHRLVYFAYFLAAMHFLTINPQLLFNPAGYLLLTMVFLVLAGQLYWFIQTIRKKKSSRKSMVVGTVIIFLWLIFVYMAFLAPYFIEKKAAAQKADLSKTAPIESMTKEEYRKMIDSLPKGLPMAEAVEEMKKFMQDHKEGDPFVNNGGIDVRASIPKIVKSGKFENLNYMTTGVASIEDIGGSYYVNLDPFDTPNGPDLVVYLTKNSEPTNREDITKGIELGELISVKGFQQYKIPEGTYINEYKSVTIHCRAFNVPWSYAKLA